MNESITEFVDMSKEELQEEMQKTFAFERVLRRFLFRENKYAIINSQDFDKIDFNEIDQTSLDTVRKNNEGTKGVLKWSTEQDPSFLQNLTSFEGPFTIEEVSHVLLNPEWNGGDDDNV